MAEDLEAVWARVRRTPPDEDAVRELIVRWLPAVLTYTSSVVRADLGAAEEVAGDGFVTIVRNRGAIPDAAAAVRYLWRTVARAARRARARAARRAARETAYEHPPDTSATVDPTAGLVRAEAAADIAAALDRLSENERCAIVLVHFLGYTEVAAGGVMGCSRSSVSAYLGRARDKLRVSLGRWNGGLGGVGGLAVAGAGAGFPSAAFATEVLRRAALPGGPGLGAKAVAVLCACGVGCGGAAAVMVANSGRTVEPAARPPLPIIRPKDEPVPDRTLRVFRDDVLPRQLTALTVLCGPDGTVRLESARSQGTWLQCVYALTPAGHTADAGLRLEFVRDTLTGATATYHGLGRNGRIKPLDPRRPIILGRNPFSGAELTIQLHPLETAIREFDRFPRDGRAEEEARACRPVLERAVARLLGRWYMGGSPDRAFDITREAGRLLWRGVPPHGGEVGVPLTDLWFDPDGRAHTLPMSHGPGVLSADGRRVTFDGSDDCWSRDPVSPPP